ncbi:VWA domain-containing protein [Thiomicrorhabdus sp. 6S3-12]|uniref:VWA domain-containing protein n=1 Tax=Thiomicrorhabdus sp. 6S3-12 TaxID=2819681 RepID=UPI001AAD0FD1|nr:VWA domain-containing protein [Thiomicrorhabdus sp. 6S3-12]MBO1924829.1 VWA domain-containing protein [Thiomicrorhabdus sp. 6S3-12]
MLGFEVNFLRPWWFLTLLPVAWLLWRAWQVKAKQGAWHQVIAPKFRQLLLSQPHNESSVFHKLWLIALGLVWLLMSVILAGPSLKSVEIPAQKSQQGTVIVLDLSLSMLADDLTPSRLNRVKYKLTDLLTQHPEMPVGMVVYAGSAHTISPISEDNQTLLSLIPPLNPLIMPQYGSDPLSGLEQAKALLEGAHITQGHLIWITDDIETDQTIEIEKWFAQNPYSLRIITVGTAQGAAINLPNYGLLKDDQGQVVLASVPVQRFANLSQKLQAPIQSLKIEQNDLDWLLPGRLQAAAADKENNKEVVHPLDEGAAILLLLVPLIAFLFRRGLLFALTPLMLTFSLSVPDPAYAESQLDDLANMFQSHNQQAYKAFNRNNFESAEALFEDKQWRAASLYRLGRYKEAAKFFEQDNSARGKYNLGNALAKSGDLKGAQKAYQQALKTDPDIQDAKENLQLINRLLQEQEQQQQNQPQNQQEQQNANSQNASGQETPSEKQSNQNQGTQTQKEQEQARSEQNETDTAEKDQDQKSSQQENNSNSAGQSADQASSDANGNNGQSENAREGEEQKSHNTIASEQESAEDQQSPQKAGSSRLIDEPAKGTPSENQDWEEQQATEAWLQQIPDQPGLFLKRKFEYQYQQRPPEEKQMEKKW